MSNMSSDKRNAIMISWDHPHDINLKVLAYSSGHFTVMYWGESFDECSVFIRQFLSLEELWVLSTVDPVDPEIGEMKNNVAWKLLGRMYAYRQHTLTHNDALIPYFTVREPAKNRTQKFSGDLREKYYAIGLRMMLQKLWGG